MYLCSACASASLRVRHCVKVALTAQRSQQQREVCDALTALGLGYVCEDGSSGLSIDVAVPSIRLAIEVGP